MNTVLKIWNSPKTLSLLPKFNDLYRTFKMFFLVPLFLSLAPSAFADSAGYDLPSSGTASTTQFLIGPELSGGTACGMTALPNGATSTSGAIGEGDGPGYLYAAINQLAFGANPSGETLHFRLPGSWQFEADFEI